MTRILCLDDDREMGYFLTLLLERAGYEVIYTADNYEAWALLHSLPVDLLTQDCLRPGMDGRDYYHLLQADPALRSIPVLMISAAAALPDVAALPADGCLQKPPTLGELLATIDSILVRRGKPLPTAAERRRGENLPVQGNPALELAALADPDSFIRRRAIRRLGYLNATEAVEPLVGLLAAAEAEVRLEAARALGQLGDRQAVQPLLAALANPDWRVRWAAARSLGRLRAEKVTSALLAALTDEQPIVGLMAGLALEEILAAKAGDPGGSAVIEELGWPERAGTVQKLERICQGPDPLVSLRIVAMLSRLPRPDIGLLPVLLAQVRHPAPLVRHAAIRLLAEFAQDASPDGRREAGETLFTSPRQALPIFLDRLRDEAPEIRAEAAHTLGFIGDRREMEALVAVLDDPAPDVVRAAIAALKIMVPPDAIPAGSTTSIAELIAAAGQRLERAN